MSKHFIFEIKKFRYFTKDGFWYVDKKISWSKWIPVTKDEVENSLFWEWYGDYYWEYTNYLTHKFSFESEAQRWINKKREELLREKSLAKRPKFKPKYEYCSLFN